jgi:hypothetical protein
VVNRERLAQILPPDLQGTIPGSASPTLGPFPLLWPAKLASQPTHRIFGLERIRPIAL